MQFDDDPELFPLDFRDVVIDNNTLLNQLPNQARNIGAGTLLDPEHIGAQYGSPSNGFPFKKMNAADFGEDLIGKIKNGNDHEHGGHYFPVESGDGSGIHNQFSNNGRTFTTAVGGGNTLVILPPVSPLKMAYICFDGRNENAEALAGAPSGGGWHEIGDFAETVINSLETAPILFGYANGQPGGEGLDYALGLSDVVTIRALQPGFALVTAAGDTTRAEEDAKTPPGGQSQRGQTNTSKGRNYHWFAFHQPHEVCAVEWVHNCRPTPFNKMGTDCPPK